MAPTRKKKSHVKNKHGKKILKENFTVLTYSKGNLPETAKDIETAGLKWAPEICPSAYISAIRQKPQTIAIPKIVKDLSLSTSAAPHPVKIKIYVPRSSAIIWFCIKKL